MATMKLSEVELGEVVRFGTYSPMFAQNPNHKLLNSWYVVGKNLPGYPQGSVVLMSSQVIGLSAFNIEASNNHTDFARVYGYKDSIVDQYLTSEDSQFNYQVPSNAQGKLKAPEARVYAGFMHGFTISEKEALLPVRIKYQVGREERFIERKVFAPSTTELGLNNLFTSSFDTLGNSFSGTRFQVNANRLSMGADTYVSDHLNRSEEGRNRYWVRDTDQYKVGAMQWTEEYGQYNAYPVGEESNQVFGIAPVVCLSGENLVSYRTSGAKRTGFMVITNAGTHPITNVEIKTDNPIHRNGVAHFSSNALETSIFNNTPLQTAMPIVIKVARTLHKEEGRTAFVRIERSINGGNYEVLHTSIISNGDVIYKDTTHDSASKVRYRITSFDKSEVLPKEAPPYTTGEYTLLQTGPYNPQSGSRTGYAPNITTPNVFYPTLKTHEEFLAKVREIVIESNSDNPASYKVRKAIMYSPNDYMKVFDSLISPDFPRENEYGVGAGRRFNLPITKEEWLKIKRGHASVIILAYNVTNKNANIITFGFEKKPDGLSIELSRPLLSSTRPKKLNLDIVRHIPTGASFRVLACNNGFDTKPKWEDVTSAVERRVPYTFTNETKTDSRWGVSIRVLVERQSINDSLFCRVSSIGGGFE